MNHPKYRADIDGLRTIAVFSVVIYHAFENYLKGGFVGVDIFFVISGYLISTILFQSIARNDFRFIDFYARRVRRIFPALLCVLISCLGFGWLVLLPDEFEQLGKHVAAGAGFTSNFMLWKEAGYFDISANTKPLLHLWSLGIEEQFYLLWPLLVWLTAKIQKRNFLLLTFFVGVVSFGFNLYEVQHDPTADFYSPLTRFWELMMGGILAHFSLHQHNWLFNAERHFALRLNERFPSLKQWRKFLWPNIKSIAGIGLIAFSICCFDRKLAFPGWRAFCPALGACLLISAGAGAWFNRVILSNRLMVWGGLISYPLYLWHWPLLSFAYIVENRNRNENMSALLLLASLVLAVLTYLFVERPIRFSKDKNNLRAFLMAFSLLIVALAGVSTEYVSSRIMLAYGAYASAEKNYAPGLTTFVFQDHTYFSKKSALNTKTLYIGDSNAIQYSPRIVKLIDANPQATNSAIFSIAWGCPPIPNIKDDVKHAACADFVNNSKEYLKLNPDIDTVVIVAEWVGDFWNPDHTTFYYEKSDGSKEYLGPKYSGTQRAFDELENFLKTFTALGKRTYLVLNIPVGGDFNPRELIENRFAFGHYKFKEIEDNKTKFLARYAPIRDGFLKAAKVSGAKVIDPMVSLCPGDICLSIDDNGPIYVDDEHLRASYTREHVSYMDETIKAINSH